MNTKQNNKGFSLVELIVVIAIMGILAVTLAPRLSQYVEKARVASDQEAVNTIFTAAKLAYMQFPEGFQNGTDGLLVQDGTDTTLWTWDLGNATATTSLFDIANKKWTLGAYTETNADALKALTEMKAVLSTFSLKSKDADASTQITLMTKAGVLSVELDYDGGGAEYTVSE